MFLVQTMKLDFVWKIVLLVTLLPIVTSRPSAKRSSSDIFNGTIMPVLKESIERDPGFQAAMNKFLYNKEHSEFRRMLKLAIMIADNKDEHNEESGVLRNLNTSDMPFYFDYIKSLVNGKTMKRRSHKRRRSFDSIGHRASGLGGLGGSYTGKKVEEYSLEQLLPFIIAELRNNNKFGATEFYF